MTVKNSSVIIKIHKPVFEFRFPSAKVFIIPSMLALSPFIFQLPPTKNLLSILQFVSRNLSNRPFCSLCLVTWPLNESEAGNLVPRVLSLLRDGRETAGNEGKLLGRSWLHYCPRRVLAKTRGGIIETPA